MFLALLIGGQDRGQVRFGLMAKEEPAPLALPAPAKAAPAPVVPVAFVPAPAPAPEPVTRPLPEAVAAVPAPAPEPAAVAEPEPLRVMYVASAAINVRGGPSTNDAVVGRLTRNEAVQVVAEAGDGWVQVRIEGDGIEGYVAARLLTDRAP
ncbi:MAG TPA: SH3 domain-containing protein [Paracoccaceae bacterium]|nr:SH3 domain-containing protein [Paracoccaceae bacterium]